ncbi:GPALPP motifs-containing protein 1 [Protopterus annectens]|uniref:GPALPP motifs-containing protein 1 n=1 Tax=Protopterus annectens TaxID=7888 RepID=UPI001CF9D10C|nr:GPALPP motifs-containing protein 1 [Protopterus annectens]
MFVPMTSDIIGPALPPGFKSVKEQDQDVPAGPALPPGYVSDSSGSLDTSEEDDCSEKVVGPSLPPGFTKKHSKNKTHSDPKSSQKISQVVSDDDSDHAFFGPALPPGFKKEASPDRPVIGPALPPGFKKSEPDLGKSSTFTEAALLQGYTEKSSDSSDDDIIGPLPAKSPVQNTVSMEFEYRAQKMKEKLTSGDGNGCKQQVRESWMTELPPELKDFGLGPRTFKRRAGEESGDRSVWTDTPSDRERKSKEKKEAKSHAGKKHEEKPAVSEYDRKLKEQVTEYNNSSRSESLLDMHRKKLKRKAEKEKGKPEERKPFNREEDLQVHRFDEAQKRALLKRSQELNTRFSHSKSNMFL